MHLQYIVAATIFLGVISTVYSQCLTNNDARGIRKKNAQKALYTGQQEFSLAMMKEIIKQNPQTSVFFSPYSTYHALLLAYFISRNHTEASLKQALRIPADHDKIDVMQAYNFEKLLRNVNSINQTYQFSSANRIYVSSNVTVRPCMTNIFLEELRKADFYTNPEKSRLEINKWVESVTKGQIKDILMPGMIDQDTNLVLANAAYFKGTWENEFDKEITRKDVFHISGSEKAIVDMMVQEGTFKHEASETLGAHILELPYDGKDISMFIFLPPFATETGVDNILEKLNGENFQELVQEGGMYPKTVIVSLPKFTVEQTLELVPVLEGIGVGDLFKIGADLSTLTGQRNIDLGGAIHKAKIIVDEKGTEAAAATILFTFRSSRPVEPAIFNCNHPFIYTIYDRSSQTILFAGIFRKP